MTDTAERTGKLAEAEAVVARMKREIATADCREVGCQMVHTGGRNACCGDGCQCSIPVHVCPKCGDSDYGDNAEAREKIAACARDDYPGHGFP
jgi:hypothetical protein